MTAAAHAPTASEYIVHHLGHFSSQHQSKIVDFTIFNLDTIFWSVVCGVFACLMMYLAARKATSGVPGRFQSFVEMVVEMVEDQSKAIVHGDRSFIAPLALTVFIWVALMNSLDFLPVDLVSGTHAHAGHGMKSIYRIVPYRRPQRYPRHCAGRAGTDAVLQRQDQGPRRFHSRIVCSTVRHLAGTVQPVAQHYRIRRETVSLGMRLSATCMRVSCCSC